ncbi:MAG: hypothetical protein WAQ24_02885 [Candidatus Saccharimonadales bacterium]
MPSQVSVSEGFGQLFARPNEAEIYFSDVFPRTVPPDTAKWWPYTDFDAGLTTDARNKGLNDSKYNIAEHSWMVPYYLVLVDDLVRGQQERADKLEQAGNVHCDAVSFRNRALGAVVVVANQAYRDDAHTVDGMNGEDFHLAVTDFGLEICVTPLSFLASLEARNRLRALYRIPTKGHPEFNGDYEQFRSSHVATSRQYPNHLERVFEYPSIEALLKAKESGEHPMVIPQHPQLKSRLAFADRFGNIKLETFDMTPLRRARVGQQLRIIVRNNMATYEFDGAVADNMHSAPGDEFVVYENVSDVRDNTSKVGFTELVVRVNGNPAISTRTAMHRLLKAIPDLDPETAEFELSFSA